MLDPDQVREAVHLRTETSKAGSAFCHTAGTRKRGISSSYCTDRCSVRLWVFFASKRRRAVRPEKVALLPVLELYTMNKASFCSLGRTESLAKPCSFGCLGMTARLFSFSIRLPYQLRKMEKARLRITVLGLVWYGLQLTFWSPSEPEAFSLEASCDSEISDPCVLFKSSKSAVVT